MLVDVLKKPDLHIVCDKSFVIKRRGPYSVRKASSGISEQSCMLASMTALGWRTP